KPHLSTVSTPSLHDALPIYHVGHSRSISDVSGTTQQESILLRLRPSGQIHRLITGHQRLCGLLGGCTPATPSCGSVATASTTVSVTLLAGQHHRVWHAAGRRTRSDADSCAHQRRRLAPSDAESRAKWRRRRWNRTVTRTFPAGVKATRGIPQ